MEYPPGSEWNDDSNGQKQAKDPTFVVSLAPAGGETDGDFLRRIRSGPSMMNWTAILLRKGSRAGFPFVDAPQWRYGQAKLDSVDLHPHSRCG